MTKKLQKLSELQLQIYVWTTCALCVAFTIARGIGRWRQQKAFHADDYWAFTGAFSLIVVATHIHFMLPTLFEMQRYSDGDPPHWPIEKFAVDGPIMLKILFSMMLFFWTTLWSVKASFLMLIERLVAGLRVYKRWWWVVVIITVMMYIGSLLNNVLACLPFHRRWSLDPEVVCTRPDQLGRSNLTVEIPTAFDVVSDIAILIMPVWILSSLKLPTIKRFGIIVMFLFSILVVCISVVRVVIVSGLGEQIDLVLLITWSWTEIAAAMFIVNLLPFKAILTRFLYFSPQSSSDCSSPPSYVKKFKSSLSGQRSQGSEIQSESRVELNDIELGQGSATVKREPSVSESELGLTCQAHAFSEGSLDNQQTGIAVTSEIVVTRAQRKGEVAKPTRLVEPNW